mgnify:CR=1 FL=1
MQLMSWTVARLGSRFSLLFEPYRRRVMHSGIGRFLDKPLDLMVGIIEPDGTERVLPFSERGELLYNCEQFERLNSITFRGYSRAMRVRFEFNIHSVFYPQDEPLCTLPAFYLEMRVNPVQRIRHVNDAAPEFERARLFIRLRRPDTHIAAACHDKRCRIDLTYQNHLKPVLDDDAPYPPATEGEDRAVTIHERIVSLNYWCEVPGDGDGLLLDLPLTEEGSGIKWRLVWGAHCAEPILHVADDGEQKPARLRYTEHWRDLDAVMNDAIAQRDDRLAHSRRFERLIDQAPVRMAKRHLLNQTFQSFLSNTFWFQTDDGRPWFTVWDGCCLFHSTLDVEYNVALFYLAVWPDLLAMQLRQWAKQQTAHEPSNGVYLRHDLGQGLNVTGQAYPHSMPVEENANYLRLMQTYSHWSGDLSVMHEHVALIEKLANYLLWTDREACGFPTEGSANTIDDGGPAVQYARKQTYLAVKRICALRAAGAMLGRLGRRELATRCERTVADAAKQIDDAAWLGDHYAVCVDRSATGVVDAATGDPLPYEEIPGWDGYSIYTANGALLPMMIGQTPLLPPQRLLEDAQSAYRETIGPYGCSHASTDRENLWVSQNIWRDLVLRYLGDDSPISAQGYWDLQVMSNTHDRSLGFIDSYIGNNLSFNPRGIAAFGYLISYPRLVIDRLTDGDASISVRPDRRFAQRWPLLPLADWKAGKIPVCVVDAHGKVSVEKQIDPITLLGDNQPTTPQAGVIG